MRLFAALLALACLAPPADATTPLRVGSKRFTESYILAEIVAQTASAAAPVEHRPGLGNTAVVFEALKAGAIDVYPEYLGTLSADILHLPPTTDLATLRHALAPLGLGVAVPLGFANGYALATTGARAEALHLSRLSELRQQPGLTFGLSHEFLGRADGWPGLAQRYQLPQRPIGIDHGIAYDALQSGRIAVTDIYTTDARIAALGLTVLADDAGYFPRYDAVLLHRLDLPQRWPQAWAAISRLEGRIDVATMIRLNGDAELRGQSFAAIAKAFVTTPTSSQPEAAAGWRQRLFADDLGRLTREHVMLVLLAVLLACGLGLPMGAAAAAWPRLAPGVMAVAGTLQTIPSLALLALLIPLLGRIGTLPALVALTLYALLPIVRNTATGLGGVPPGLRDAGTALGLTPLQRWRHVDLPLAAPVILAGIQTAAVISVGTATIAAFIGAGGYGERIATGLALNDHAMLLAGALPAAAMALAVQALFEGLAWGLRRRGKR
jgi:osmoprotectant transport system permease protein